MAFSDVFSRLAGENEQAAVATSSMAAQADMPDAFARAAGDRSADTESSDTASTPAPLVTDDDGAGTITGSAGSDFLVDLDEPPPGEGQPPADDGTTIDAKAGNDFVFGLGGDDVIVLGRGTDSYVGGAGHDTFKVGDNVGGDGEVQNIYQYDTTDPDPEGTGTGDTLQFANYDSVEDAIAAGITVISENGDTTITGDLDNSDETTDGTVVLHGVTTEDGDDENTDLDLGDVANVTFGDDDSPDAVSLSDPLFDPENGNLVFPGIGGLLTGTDQQDVWAADQNTAGSFFVLDVDTTNMDPALRDQFELPDGVGIDGLPGDVQVSDNESGTTLTFDSNGAEAAGGETTLVIAGLNNNLDDNATGEQLNAAVGYELLIPGDPLAA